MGLELLPISLLKSCPFFWACPLVQEEAIPDRKLKYFSSKNPATSACFWRFLGSTGSTRNGARVCWGRSQDPAPGLRSRSAGRRSVQWKSVRLTLPPLPFPARRTSREALTLLTLLVSGKKQPGRSQAIPGPKKWPSRAGAVVREIG